MMSDSCLINEYYNEHVGECWPCEPLCDPPDRQNDCRKFCLDYFLLLLRKPSPGSTSTPTSASAEVTEIAEYSSEVPDTTTWPNYFLIALLSVIGVVLICLFMQCVLKGLCNVDMIEKCKALCRLVLREQRAAPPEGPQQNIPMLPRGAAPEGPQQNIPMLPRGAAPEGPQQNIPMLPRGAAYEGPQQSMPMLPRGAAPEGPQQDIQLLPRVVSRAGPHQVCDRDDQHTDVAVLRPCGFNLSPAQQRQESPDSNQPLLGNNQEAAPEPATQAQEPVDPC